MTTSPKITEVKLIERLRRSADWQRRHDVGASNGYVTADDLDHAANALADREALEQEKALLKTTNDIQNRALLRLADQAKAAEALADRLAEALKPFAEVAQTLSFQADAHGGRPFEVHKWEAVECTVNRVDGAMHGKSVVLAVEDFQRALAAFETSRPDEKETND